MVFPDYVDAPKTEGERARLRLKYMIYQAALFKYGNASMVDLAEEIDRNPSTIFNALAKGKFSEELAELIVSALGTKVIKRHGLKREWLLEPLNVGVKAPV